MANPADEWIASISRGKTFGDFGGVWGATGEKASIAGRNGATSVTILDELPRQDPSWERVLDLAAKRGAGPVKTVTVNLNSPELIEKAGMFDVLYCSGLIYHCPDPVSSLLSLCRLTKEDLIVGSIIIPPDIKNDQGKIQIGDSGALFVPALTASERRILVAHFDFPERAAAEGLDREVSWFLKESADGVYRFNYSPYWWLYTPRFIEKVLEMAGLEVVSQQLWWDDRVVMFHAKRVCRDQ